MNVKNLLFGLISLGVLIGYTGGYPCMFFFGDYPYPEES